MLTDAQLSKLRGCHNSLAPVIGPDIEPFEIIAKVEELRRYWRPENPKVILLAESHVKTSAEELRSVINLTATHGHGYPRDYVRFVYCLGYGEGELVRPRPDQNRGTPQFWKIFFACVNRVRSKDDFQPVLKTGERNLQTRIRNKTRLLERLKAMGIWLVDASICGLYLPGGGKLPANVVERTLRVSWDQYVGGVIQVSRPAHVICVGKGVYKAIGERLRRVVGDEVKVFPQPQARGLSSDYLLTMHQEYYDICSKVCQI